MILLYTLLHLLSDRIALADDPPLEPVTIEDEFGRPKFAVPGPPAHAASKSASKAAAKGKRSPCPDGMAHISGGKFNRSAVPEFCLDEREVTVEAFGRYLEHWRAHGEERPKSRIKALEAELRSVDWPGLDDLQLAERSAHCTWQHHGKRPELPINCISYNEAVAYCEAQGKHLPSGRDWQWAARGGKDGRTYPWGSTRPTDKRLNMHIEGEVLQVLPVAAYEPAPGTLYDMAGNLWEWVAGDPAATSCTARGGSFRSQLERDVKVTAVLSAKSQAHRSDEIGFRCAAAVRGAGKGP